jgi:hypothetical protein
MLRLLLLVSVVLALGVGVSGALAGEGNPPNPKKSCTNGHRHKQGVKRKSKCSNGVQPVVRQQAAASISLVAPWGSAVYSGTDTITLTYSISAAKAIPSAAVDEIQQAVDDWASWFQGHDGSGSFTIAPAAAGSRADVQISTKAGGGNILGQTHWSFDHQGFIKGATVQISGSTHGMANTPATVHEITLHELGHAFVGLGHSNDPSDLMYPTLGSTSTGIGACELAGFHGLYSPWLTDGSSATGPTLPTSGLVDC